MHKNIFQKTFIILTSIKVCISGFICSVVNLEKMNLPFITKVHYNHCLSRPLQRSY